MPTLCVATQPFRFEGKPRMGVARAAAPEIRAATDGLILIPNDKLFKSIGSDKVNEAFPAADQALGLSVLSVWHILTRPGYLNAGPSELARITKADQGIACLAWAEGKGRRRAQIAVKQLLEHPLLDGGGALADCRSILVNVVAGDDLTLKELEEVMTPIKAASREQVDMAVGTSTDPEWNSRLLLTLIAARPGGWIGGGAEPRAAATPSETADLPLVENPVLKGGRRGGVQITMQLEPAGRGRFVNTDPTLMDGEDLDIPTYQRRNIKL
jgi:cell division protein FtsZ